ncbi:Ribonucleases P/MRP protein subunit POP1, partial [Camponotus floridanus]
ICLETHTWHANRFQMIDKWGYKIPYYLNDKSHKASNNGETKYCLLQDIYY